MRWRLSACCQAVPSPTTSSAVSVTSSQTYAAKTIDGTKNTASARRLYGIAPVYRLARSLCVTSARTRPAAYSDGIDYVPEIAFYLLVAVFGIGMPLVMNLAALTYAGYIVRRACGYQPPVPEVDAEGGAERTSAVTEYVIIFVLSGVGLFFVVAFFGRGDEGPEVYWLMQITLAPFVTVFGLLPLHLALRIHERLAGPPEATRCLYVALAVSVPLAALAHAASRIDADLRSGSVRIRRGWDRPETRGEIRDPLHAPAGLPETRSHTPGAAIDGFRFVRHETFRCGELSHRVAVYASAVLDDAEFVLLPPDGRSTIALIGDALERQRISRGYLGDPRYPIAIHPMLVAREPRPKASWENARSRCLTAGLRLPSSSELEYVHRGGSTGPYCTGDEEPSDAVVNAYGLRIRWSCWSADDPDKDGDRCSTGSSRCADRWWASPDTPKHYRPVLSVGR